MITRFSRKIRSVSETSQVFFSDCSHEHWVSMRRQGWHIKPASDSDATCSLNFMNQQAQSYYLFASDDMLMTDGWPVVKPNHSFKCKNDIGHQCVRSHEHFSTAPFLNLLSSCSRAWIFQPFVSLVSLFILVPLLPHRVVVTHIGHACTHTVCDVHLDMYTYGRTKVAFLR